MKNLFLLLMLIISVQTNLIAQNNNEYYTNFSGTDLTNGRMWKTFSTNEKNTYIVAALEGVTSFLWKLNGEYSNDINNLEKINEIKEDGFGISGFYPKEIASMIDKFYSDAINIRIPIIYALNYCVYSVAGKNKEYLENYLSSMRENSNK